MQSPSILKESISYLPFEEAVIFFCMFVQRNINFFISPKEIKLIQDTLASGVQNILDRLNEDAKLLMTGILKIHKILFYNRNIEISNILFKCWYGDVNNDEMIRLLIENYAYNH